MSRPLRLEFADALYHVTARGNAREDISRDDGDRATFLDLLGRRHAQAYRCVINLLRRVVNDPIVKVARRAGISAPRVAQIQAAGKALGRKGGCGNCWITIR
jgi:DNA-nicking Smr family endonuclease